MTVITFMQSLLYRRLLVELSPNALQIHNPEAKATLRPSLLIGMSYPMSMDLDSRFSWEVSFLPIYDVARSCSYNLLAAPTLHHSR